MRALLINPWIYDFSAFDLWMKPLGLLYIGAVLAQYGFEVNLLDCLDRYHPDLIKNGQNKPKGEKKYGCGNFHKEEIIKPDCLKDVTRQYSRYGLPIDSFVRELKKTPKPNVILITSMMTYWYPAVRDTVNILRNMFGDTPIILGGVYAGLVPDHAEKTINVDRIITGEGENQVVAAVAKQLGKDTAKFKEYASIDDYPLPAFHLLKTVRYLPVLTSRGCPFSCTFCASRLISGSFRMRSPESVIDEILFHHKKYSVRDFAFYDDALLVNKEQHIMPILEGLLAEDVRLRFHSPNGLSPAMIDDDTAEVLYKSRFKTVRLSLETIHPGRLKDMNEKVTVDEFTRCVDSLAKAGFKRKSLETYILYGLPRQSVEEVMSTIRFVESNGVKVRLAEFSPIPGTVEWERAVSDGEISAEDDLLLTNKTLLPVRSKVFDWNTVEKLKKYTRNMNEEFENSDIHKSNVIILTSAHTL
ncbi:B12-binding domain-containing radical SAM protein [candidate division KSB1 bacterium]